MKDSNRKAANIVQGSNATFELHTIGWDAFQNLCGHVTSEVLGQTATVFSHTKDAGQDGAFQGIWKKQNQEAFQGRFVIQCKFTSRRDDHLTLSRLKDELEKARKLGIQGVAQTYLLMTNAKVSGESDLAIREEFTKIRGINHFDILGEEWITQSIIASKRLRAFVPRVYGLGDLSQILDERAYRQADEILQSWKDNLAKFVPTNAHELSVRALLDKGFVLLLGDPMAGKSTIAAALALAAADQWNCSPVFIRHPDDFAKHWNPDERQFFWADDAFGQIQLESRLVTAWNRTFPHLMAAIGKGSRVLFTSRSYICRAAMRELKQTAFPLLKDSRVVIEVEALRTSEKERILYNHLRLGGQKREFRRKIKHYLPSIARNPKFFPEIAKRLGDPFFTSKLTFQLFTTQEEIRKFVEEPIGYLYDVIDQLDKSSFAALAFLFMRAGRISIPPAIGVHETVTLELLGSSLADICESLRVLEGSLTTKSLDGGEMHWKFRHPTIRDAMATHIADRSELIDIYLAGANVFELLNEIVCIGVEVEGAKVYVSESRFAALVDRIRSTKIDSWKDVQSLMAFLLGRCSDSFLKDWGVGCPDQLKVLAAAKFTILRSVAQLLRRLQAAKALPEAARLIYVAAVEREAITNGDSDFLLQDSIDLVTVEELDALTEKFKVSLVPMISGIVDEITRAYDDIDVDPTEHFSELHENLDRFAKYYEGNEELHHAFMKGLELIDDAIGSIIEANHQERKRIEEEEEEKQRQ